MGGALLQNLNRDFLKFAMKTSAAFVDGEWRDVYKDPITDHAKKSKKGRLALCKNVAGEYITIKNDEAYIFGLTNRLETVYRNGEIFLQYTLKSVRERARQ
jgi:nicotinamide phosphoribosyltransferase